MEKTLLIDFNLFEKKSLLPILFRITKKINLKRVKRNKEFRIITSKFHQSEIYCLRNYKDGININTTE